MAINDMSAAAGSTAAAPQGVGAPGWIDYHAGPPGGEATRHLQAAAHLDRVFRDRVITELVEERHRVSAPTPGIDPAAVLGEALRARRHSLWTALACTLVLLMGLAADWATALFALSIVVVVLFYRLWVRWAAGLVLRVLPVYDTPERHRFVQRTLRAFLLPVAVYAVFLVAVLLDWVYLVVTATDSWGVPSLDALSSGSDVTGFYGDGGSGPWVTPVAMLLGWALIGGVSRFLRAQRLAVLGDPRSSDGGWNPPSWLASVFESLRTKAPEAETVYGEYEPFVGSGLRVDEWSLQTELRPASPESTPEPLTVAQVHEQIAAWQQALSTGEDYPGDVLRSLVVRDRVLRNGLRVEPQQAWFGALSPENGTDGRRTLRREWVHELDRAAHPRLRHYVEGRTELWNGQVVVSTFVRVTLQGHQLYVEGLEYVLPPVAARYRAVDHMLPPDGLDLLRSFGSAVVNLGRDFGDNLAQVWATTASLYRGWTRRRWRAGMLRAGRLVQHAPRASIRELGAEDRFQVLFQFLDAERVWSALRERTLTSVVALLKQHGYDTAQFEAGAQYISVNNGIQNYNSEVSGAQAVGERSRAMSRPSVPKPRMGAN